FFAVDFCSSVELYTPGELTVENGTQAKLSCTFKSTEVVHSGTVIIWKFKEDGSTADPVKILVYMGGKPYLSDSRFTERTSWAGDLNKKDASILIDKVTFKDNGTYICDVIIPNDVGGKPKELKLRVVEKAVHSSTPFSILFCHFFVCCLASFATRHSVFVPILPVLASHCGGSCSTTESLMSPVKQLPSKSPSDTEALVTNAPTGTMQGPVIYAQLDHSGKPGNQVNKSERVVYADIRKVC
ncbi:unnamed protein product, partial [Staurois parvus]